MGTSRFYQGHPTKSNPAFGGCAGPAGRAGWHDDLQHLVALGGRVVISDKRENVLLLSILRLTAALLRFGMYDSVDDVRQLVEQLVLPFFAPLASWQFHLLWDSELDAECGKLFAVWHGLGEKGAKSGSAVLHWG